MVHTRPREKCLEILSQHWNLGIRINTKNLEHISGFHYVKLSEVQIYQQVDHWFITEGPRIYEHSARFIVKPIKKPDSVNDLTLFFQCHSRDCVKNALSSVFPEFFIMSIYNQEKKKLNNENSECILRNDKNKWLQFRMIVDHGQVF